jgi:hypothetical protein
MRGADFVPGNGRDPSQLRTLTETNEAFMTAEPRPGFSGCPGSGRNATAPGRPKSGQKLTRTNG